MSMLEHIIATLRNSRHPLDTAYTVPGLWADGHTTDRQWVDPYEYYAWRLEAIKHSPAEPLIQAGNGGGWSTQAIVYNMMPRVAAAFSHADDGQVRVAPRADGWRDTGTLLKAIAMLSYISGLGCNTVHLLPITSVGQHGKKGSLGSPYAIRNPYVLDPNLAEPALPLTAEQLFEGFMEAAHHLGLRVVVEFVLRTASRDSDWAGEHPDWFYWIREDILDREQDSDDASAYGQPLFDEDTLGLVKWKGETGDWHDLPAPSDEHRQMFTPPPLPENVRLDEGRWLGTLDDGTTVRIPGAFTDWPPDGNQPIWSDVTYLRLYDHPDFNYIAYNTLRMYDQRLAQPGNANHALWDAIVGIIPYFQRTFGIDGMMLDMGHALPAELKQRMVQEAKAINPEFAFWEENFAIEESSRHEDYDAVVGFVVLAMQDPDAMRHFIQRLDQEWLPIPFFATPENHNTPRAAARFKNGSIYSYYALPLSIGLSGIPFIHSGFELGEKVPVNTGLSYTEEMLRDFPPEKLPLFSAYAYDWTCEENLTIGVRHALELRQRYADLLSDPSPDTWYVGMSDDPAVQVFTRRKEHVSLTFIFNTDMKKKHRARVLISGHWHRSQGVWGADHIVQLHHGLDLTLELAPGYVMVLEGEDLPF